ncbi:hypothetical protein SAMN05421640_1089 [Ekhidna lutea]|uniref:Uncharacterized protein n=1 Tax=Ekhidna lutea TaxID=447679 RepID=A0A239H0Y5_EKHLU|nr:hypothetical protein [Ekhidna lutea]SNS74842.1 hypothetical protein SAMN05421640_1089 [Ekhidna lutea]
MKFSRIRTFWVLALLGAICVSAQGQFRNILKPQQSPIHELRIKADEEYLSNQRDRFRLKSPLGPQAHLLRANSYKKIEDKIRREKPCGFWIKSHGDEYLYKNQELYVSNIKGEILGRAKKWKINKKLRKTFRALRQLEKKSQYARNIIQTLQYSENRFTLSIVKCIDSYTLFPLQNDKYGVLNNNAYAFQVMENDQLLVDYAPFDRIGSGAEIRWEPRHKKMKLAHELAHAYDANFGLLDDRLIKSNGNIMPAREIRALFHENMIRKEMERNLRTRINSGEAWLALGVPYTYPLPVTARY